MILKKILTFVRKPHKAIRKYFRKLVLREILPIYDENYDECWGSLSYRDKIVLDLGADYGSTAYYFLKRGAAGVIAVEGDADSATLLVRNYGADPRVVCVTEWINDPKSVEDLIRKYPVDVVKADIEGAEIHIAGVASEVLSSVKEWVIEAHSKGVYDELAVVFLKLGFKVFAIHYGEVGVYRILIAKKRGLEEKRGVLGDFERTADPYDADLRRSMENE